MEGEWLQSRAMGTPAIPANRMTTRTYVRNGVRTNSAGVGSKKKKPASEPAKNGTAHAALPGPTVIVNEKAGTKSRIFIGDCREVLASLPEVKESKLDLVFADPPFNWNRAYDKWDDKLAEDEYLTFTYDWLDACVKGLRPGGALWVNIPDDWAAEIVCYMKRRMDRKPPANMVLQNWCVWHYRFGQNAVERFINSKVHALYFIKQGKDARRGPTKDPEETRRGLASRAGGHTWNPIEVAEMSDRAAIYGDKRTLSKKDGMPPGRRVPMDVWYGQYWGRVQGNNTERRHYHDNQLPEVYLERVVRACSNEKDLVLDPFLGSGTTGVMAHALGRNFIGTEFSAENAGHAVERIIAGPVRLGAGIGTSSAIFEKRREL